MTREIKFRAWDKVNKRMFKDCFSLVTEGCTIWHGFQAHSSSGLIWMQYTGLKDKNGTEIYEGDKGLGRDVTPGKSEPKEWIVVFKAGAFCYQLKGSDTIVRSWSSIYDFEITGNIYEQ